jgi:hypothetical protein
VTVTPPNLRALFGDRFQIGHDPAAETAAERNDPWMMMLPCENGVIYPHGANRLAVECKTKTAHKLMAISAITVQQHGDTECTLLFNLAMADQVFGIVKPRKRRKLSEEQKAANVERLKDHQFQNGTQPRRRKSSKDEPGAPKAA